MDRACSGGPPEVVAARVELGRCGPPASVEGSPRHPQDSTPGTPHCRGGPRTTRPTQSDLLDVVGHILGEGRCLARIPQGATQTQRRASGHSESPTASTPVVRCQGRARSGRAHSGVVTPTRYAQRRLYVVPARLDDLDGPVQGVLELPADLGWTGRRRYDLDDPADVAVLYERIIVEATSLHDLDLLAAPTVRLVWPRLFLPAPVRELWQARFPELTRVA